MSETTGWTGGVRALAGTLVLVNLVAFLVMVLTNVDSLGTVEFQFYGSGGTTYSFNLYDLFSVIATIFALLVVASLVMFGFGVSSEGISTMFRWISISVLWELLSIGTAYWFRVYPPLATIWMLLTTTVLVVYILARGAESGTG